MKEKLLNILIVLAIVIGFLPQNVFAIDENSRTYVYDNFTVDYNITNSWGNTQNISISVTNTGSEPIENWMLAYNFQGEIHDIWNAEIKENTDGVKYIRNLGYNNIIEPTNTISFGYALDNASGLPDSFSMCQKRVTKESGFDVNLTILDSWDDSFKGEITIQNNTDAAIECWELSFDSNFTTIEITDSWAASIINNDNGTYTLKGTYTNIIYANSSVTLGFMGIKDGEPEIFNYSLTEVTADKINIPEEKDPDDSDDPYVHVDDMYYKPIQSSDDIDYDGEGIYFVRNQILVTAYQDVPFDDVKELADRYNAKIVGYIDLTNDYQLEFQSDLSAELLYQQIEEICNDPLVEYASLNMALSIGESDDSEAVEFPKESDLTEFKESIDPNDPEKCKKKSALNKYAKWHIETIRADKAWNEHYDSMSEVKLGIIDQAFYYLHKDLNDNFSKGIIWEIPNEYVNYDIFSHGTHVAGIMAAGFNNSIGISGICPKNALYAYSVYPIIADNIPMNTSIMQFKIAFATLIANNVKVINISLDDNVEVCIGATHGNENALNYINESSEIFGKFLKKIIDLEYDFLIVSVAGNTNDDEYIKDENQPFGYRFLDENDQNVNENDKMTGARAEYLSYWNYIGYKNYLEFKDVRDRIIVVGSIGMKAKQNKGKDKDEDDQTDPDTCDEEEQSDPDEREYYYSEFSCYGDRVDIVAPGENIFSTVEPLSAKYKDRNGNGYRFKNGTSMAAPQVAGVAGMIYSIRPDLTASRVKEIIIESAKNSAKSEGNREITHIQYDKNGKPINPNTYYVLDAEAALKKAMDEGNGDEPDEKDNAIIYGKVTDKNGEPVNNAKIYATSETTKKIFEFYSDEEGDYLLSLPPDTYTITFVGDEVIIDKVVFNGHGWTNKGTSYYATDSMKIKAKEVYPLDVQLDSYSYKEISVLGRTGNGELEYLYNVQIDIVKNATFTNTINEKIYYTNLEDGDYYIKAYKAGYIPQTLSVKVINGIICDNGRNKLTEIVLEPVKKSTISGSVLLYNETTYDVSPIENQSIFIYKCDSGDPSVMKYSSDEPYLVCTTTTNSKGIYEVEVEGTGEYIIKFDEDKQETVHVNGDKYTVNACYIINGDDNDGNGNGNGNGGGDKDDGKVQLGLPGIIYDYWGGDGREDRYYTIYYCSSITITKPYSDSYQVYGVYRKIISKSNTWYDEEIKIYDSDISISYLTPYPDGHKGDKTGSHKIVLGGTCFPDRRFPYDTTSGSAPLPEEIMEKLMAGEMVIFFVDENAPDGQPLQYAVVEHEYN